MVIGGDSVVTGGASVEVDPNSHVHTACVVVDVVWGIVVVDPIVVTGIVVVDGATHAPSPVGNSSHTSPPEQHLCSCLVDTCKPEVFDPLD